MVLFLLGLFIGTIMGVALISLCYMAPDSSKDHLYRELAGEAKGREIHP